MDTYRKTRRGRNVPSSAPACVFSSVSKETHHKVASAQLSRLRKYVLRSAMAATTTTKVHSFATFAPRDSVDGRTGNSIQQ